MGREKWLITGPREYASAGSLIDSIHPRATNGVKQMAKPRWYSPQLSRDVVCRLFHKAKAEGVPMTVLANRLLEEALGNDKKINAQRAVGDRNITEPN